jgi:hypothetical protein
MKERAIRLASGKGDKTNGIRLTSVLLTLLLHVGLTYIHSRDSG